MDPNEQYIKRLAALKGKSARNCEWCRGWYLETNSRSEYHICPTCTARGAYKPVTEYMKANKLGHLTDEQRQNIYDKKVRRVGPFFKSNV